MRSETARLQSIIIDGERMEGNLIMVAITKALPRMHMRISGMLRTQFMMTNVPGRDSSSLVTKMSFDDLFSMTRDCIVFHLLDSSVVVK